MLLRRLVEYSERLELPPALYSRRPVRYIIDLNPDGTLEGGIGSRPTDTMDPADRSTKRGRPMMTPNVQRSAGIKPLMLADHAEYTFGLAREASRPERVEQCHASYVEQLERCVALTGDAGVAAVLTFLQSDPLVQLDLGNDFDPGAAITFKVAGEHVTRSPRVQNFWAQEHRPQADDAGARLMQCLVCGKTKPVLERMLGKIKGVPGGQMSGTALISANAPAFESYGLDASLIAPCCADCAERFTKSLNALLSNTQTRYYLANTVFAFWTREADTGFGFGEVLEVRNEEEVSRLLTAVRSGNYDPHSEPDAFYALSLSASGGRTVVRDWIDTTVGRVKENLARWFAGQQLVGNDAEIAPLLGLYALAAGTVRDPQKELSPPTARALLRAALTSTPLPWGLLAQALRRNQAEQAVSRPRAALIKLVLTSHHLIAEGEMVRIDFDFDDPGYLCGRLLAVLEQAQKQAIPGIKATIVDRFYGTASSAPQTVFPRLVRGAQAHFTKLRRDKPGWEWALQTACEEIIGKLPPLDTNPARAGRARGAYGVPVNFPASLTPQQQGFFALGYYHQRAWNSQQAKEASERKKGRQLAAASLDTNTLDDDADL